MSAEMEVPRWASLSLACLTPFVGACMWVFGRASKSGAAEASAKALELQVASLQKIINDLVITVSNHGQSIVVTDGRVGNLEAKISEIAVGVATLLERTKNI